MFTAAVGICSYFIVRTADPNYSATQVFRGYSAYVQIYSEGNLGLAWNSSLFGLTKEIRAILGLHPYYSFVCYSIVFAAGLAIATLAVRSIWTGNMAETEIVFAGVSFYALFTPVFALYHMLDFVAPLFVYVLKEKQSASTPADQKLFIGSLAALCPLGDQHFNGVIHAIILFAILVTVVVQSFRRPALVPE